MNPPTTLAEIRRRMARTKKILKRKDLPPELRNKGEKLLLMQRIVEVILKRRTKSLVVAAFLVTLFLNVGNVIAEEAVKKSKSGICHCPGGQYYERTKNFTAYPTIEECFEERW